LEWEEAEGEEIEITDTEHIKELLDEYKKNNTMSKVETVLNGI
jgi:hypothetical protein